METSENPPGVTKSHLIEMNRILTMQKKSRIFNPIRPQNAKKKESDP